MPGLFERIGREHKAGLRYVGVRHGWRAYGLAEDGPRTDPSAGDRLSCRPPGAHGNAADRKATPIAPAFTCVCVAVHGSSSSDLVSCTCRAREYDMYTLG